MALDYHKQCNTTPGNNPGYDAPLPPEPEKTLAPFFKVREAILSAPDWMVYSNEVRGAQWIDILTNSIEWQLKLWTRRKRKPMNVEEMAKKWEGLIVGLSTSHDKIERDRWEHDIDEMLTPILSAPVKQIREMFARLIDRLKKNKAVPFYAWRSLEVWYEDVIVPAKTQDIIKLKKELAGEIAKLVEEDVKRDIGEAVMGALMWRDTKTLTEIRDAVETSNTGKGPKASVSTKSKTVGRQSCLFLVVEQKGKELQVML